MHRRHCFPRQAAIHNTRSLRALILQISGLGFAFGLVALSPAYGEEQNEPRQSVKVMHIGNSFSNNATSYLPALAKAGGKELIIAGTVLGGCTLERHANHLAQAKAGDPAGSPYRAARSLGLPADKKMVSIPEALAAQDWDFVTIQQRSRQSYQPETFEPFAGQLIEEIREKAPQATILIHQTWAYRPDNTLFKRENMTPEQMHAGIVNAYSQLGERYNLGFLPSGNAVWMASQTPEWSYAPDPDFDYVNRPSGTAPQEKGLYPGLILRKDMDGKQTLILDAYHLNPAGRYLAGCVWYEILFNDSVLDVDYTPHELRPEQAAHLRKLAHETVASYRSNGNKL